MQTNTHSASSSSSSLKIIIDHQKNKLRLSTHSSCPSCKNSVSEAQIRNGWLDDIRDWTTQCPHCEFRYEAELTADDQHTDLICVPFICVPQLEYKLQQVVNKINGGSPIVINEHIFMESYPISYMNSIKHFGSLEKAIEKFNLNIDVI